MIQIIKVEEGFDEDWLKKRLPSRGLGNEEVLEAVTNIIEDVRRNGDEALIKYAKMFDGVDLKKTGLKVSAAEIDEAYNLADKTFVESIKLIKERVEAFHQRQKVDSWFVEEGNILLGQLVRPIGVAGIYVPGGLASYPSSVIMNAVPAKIAGVGEIVMCTPPNLEGKVNPDTLIAAREAGVNEIYRVGGAQAIAALACGTETVKKVDKITGPGNIYVTLAKKVVIGQVDIDMLAGPSEIVVLADKTANPLYIAVDMLSQAEHAPDAMAVLVTTSEALAKKARLILIEEVAKLNRREIAETSLKVNGRIFVTSSSADAVRLVNLIAPEHLELMVEKPLEKLQEIENAGAIFLGSFTPEAIGDYFAGPNHVLPTGGTARFYSPLGVEDFIKKSNVLFYDKESLKRASKTVKVIAKTEGLEAHFKSIEIRFED
ncbi:MAG: histidinol dehydrogenase [Candidatus Subteraquimicrobiales bacterium]|nr:histidinol dehydrogenase [Candidatus Subteraquimicrobiales bacterium]